MKYFKNIFLGIVICPFLIIVFLIGAGYKDYKNVIQNNPIEQKVAQIESSMQYVTIENISSYLLEATIAIEDHRFYQHFGIDLISIMRAFLQNCKMGRIVGGGSTITQQLAKNMYYDHRPSIIRKISEIFLALDLERRYSKYKILELYVNIIHYGDSYFGIQAASAGYFGVSAKKLNLAQASLLAGIPQAPYYYQLTESYDKALIRQEDVLTAMVKKGMITEEQKEEVYLHYREHR